MKEDIGFSRKVYHCSIFIVLTVRYQGNKKEEGCRAVPLIEGALDGLVYFTIKNCSHYKRRGAERH